MRIASQLKYGLGIGAIFSVYGLTSLVVVMMPANSLGFNYKIALLAVILITLPFTLLFGWLITRRSKKKKEAKAAAAAAPAVAAPAASESANGDAAQPTKLTAPAGSYGGLNSGVEEVVQFLKSSSMGGRNKDAFYSLPWYIVAGSPKTGKSSLVIASDLNFQNLPSQRQSELRPLRRTTSVDWRVTREAVFVETAGRYQTEGPDADEWASLLETIRKARSG